MSKAIFVTGPPAAGKSTLATQIARRFSLPLFMKDDIKEALLDVLEWTDRASTDPIGRATYLIMMRIVEAQARAGKDFVLDSPFTSADSAPLLRAVQNETGFEALEILCTCEGQALYDRRLKRVESRHPGHFDKERLAEVSPADLGVKYEKLLGLKGEAIRVDTTDFSRVDLEGLFNQVAGFLS